MKYRSKPAPKTGKRPPIKGSGKILKRLLSFIFSRYKLRFVLVMICILVSSITGVIGSMFIETLVDDYIQPLLLESAPVFTGLLRAILYMAVIYAIGIIAGFTYNRTMVVISQGVLKDVRDELFTHMQGLPIGYFDSRSHGDIMSVYTNDTDSLRQMVSQSIPQMLSSLITVIAVFTSMVSISIYLTVLVLVCITLMMKITGKVAGKSSKYFAAQQSSLGTTNGYIEEIINGQKVVKVFCHENQAKADFDALNEELCANATSANKFANILMPIMANLSNLQYVLVAIVGGALAINDIGGLTLGGIMAFLQLTKTFSMPVNQVSQQLNSIVMALAGAGRIFNLIDEKHETDDGNVTLVNATKDENGLHEADSHTGIWAWKRPTDDGFEYTELTGYVRFEDVDFSYVEGKPVLHDINLYAKPGQKIAFVGSTGAGKTTITNLVNRFYDINDGKILYDGIDVKDIKKSDLRRSLGIVLQETNLFTGTIMENIRYGRLDATDEDVYAAARLANADGFISTLPNGYNTIITGNGAELSQGQRQLIAIARAAIADPPVMILDEATSSIDTRTESIVQSGMDSLMHGRTVFVIAHRLSTVRNADVIMVLEHGKIIERGYHDELIAMKGKYYQLHTGAFELD